MHCGKQYMQHTCQLTANCPLKTESSQFFFFNLCSSPPKGPLGIDHGPPPITVFANQLCITPRETHLLQLSLYCSSPCGRDTLCPVFLKVDETEPLWLLSFFCQSGMGQYCRYEIVVSLTKEKGCQCCYVTRAMCRFQTTCLMLLSLCQVRWQKRNVIQLDDVQF